MRHDTKGAARPRVNQDQHQKRLLVQMQLMRHDAQLKNFTPLRDQLAASGKDANLVYRQIQSRREQLAAELKKLAPPPRQKTVLPSGDWYQGLSLSSPVAPVRFFPGSLSPWLGYSGTIQLENAQEGVQVYPPGTVGTIETLDLDGSGGVFFGGNITAWPISGGPYNPGTFVDKDEYFWLQNWTYVIAFPPPVVESKFTYSFQVLVRVPVLAGDLSAFGWSYVSAGETPNFTGQNELVVNTNLGFPLAMVDLNAPYGTPHGLLAVQRSFVVGAGHIPAVALVVGFSAELARKADVVFDDGRCFIVPGSTLGFDIDNDSITGDQGLVHFRYDPLIPPIAQS